MQLSPQRAFVIQLAAGTQVLDDRLLGRIEHVVSNQAADFDSVADLLAFMARILREVEVHEDDEDETRPEGDAASDFA